MKRWLLARLEWALLVSGLGFLGICAIQTLEARRFQARQTAMFVAARERVEADAADAAAAAVEYGGLLGMLDVPRLDLSAPVVEGDDEATLSRAVGHLPDTPLPWHEGNSAIAAHRDGLFRPLKDIAVGDEIRFRTPVEDLRYRVTHTAIVAPDDLSVLDAGTQPTLTLITCYPFHYVGHAPRRFIVQAERDTSSR